MTRRDDSRGNQPSHPPTPPFQEGKVNKGGQNPPRPAESVDPPKPQPMSPQSTPSGQWDAAEG